MASHLTKEERDRIAQLYHRGAQQVEIAGALGRSPGTICRELARHPTPGTYMAAQAHDDAQRRRRERKLKRKMDRPEVNDAVRSGLSQYWSPEQIAGRLKRQFPDQPSRHISPQMIYTWIDRQGEDRQYWRSYLRRRGKRPYSRRENTGSAAARAKIADRPAVIENRQRRGDFEGDTVLGPPGSGGVVTLVDRQSRFTLISKVPRKQARGVHERIRDRFKVLDPSQRASATFDNGTEFARCHLLESHLRMKVYFAEPGCPYQRGTNENTNGLIRQFYPKGTDFSEITHHEVRAVENLLNNRPRACLDFQTPNEAFHTPSATSNCN